MLAQETLEEIEAYILKRLPQVLARDPQFATLIEGMLAEKFPRRDEFARLLEELQEHRRETQQQFRLVDQRFDKLEGELQEHRRETEQRFAQVDQRFDKLETEMRSGFQQVYSAIDRLGARWGIRNEKVFRQTMRELLEKSFDAQIQERYIAGEQFDCVIIRGEHILVELSASVGPNILERLQRKRKLYIDETGVTPARFLLVVGAIHSRRADALRAAGFEVVEPEDTEG